MTDKTMDFSEELAGHVFDYKNNYALFDDFYVTVSVDADGKEAVVAKVVKVTTDKAVIHSMIGGTPSDIKAILEGVQYVANATQRKIRVIKFTGREVAIECVPEIALASQKFDGKALVESMVSEARDSVIRGDLSDGFTEIEAVEIDNVN